ncbi:hypothetical protein J6590_023947 [Homalodisca vitripennis]|nr:hypothetical protein J6590_023947 [Homalodisca vitripennis]
MALPSLSVQNWRVKKNPVLQHPAYSADLALSSGYSAKSSRLKGTHFQTVEVKQNVAQVLKAHSKDNFQHCLN